MQYISNHVDWKYIKLGVQYNGEITANYVPRKNGNQQESDSEGIQITKDQEWHRVNTGGLQHVKWPLLWAHTGRGSLSNHVNWRAWMLSIFTSKGRTTLRKMCQYRNEILAQELNIHKLEVRVQDLAWKHLKTIGP